MPSGKPLSTFDPSCWSACWTEFFYGDCVPNLSARPNKKVSMQEIFSALMSREELEYAVDGDASPYVAPEQSRFDSAEFACTFGDVLRRMRLWQAVKASFSRPGYEQDLREISRVSAADFVQWAVKLETDPGQAPGSKSVATALRHLQFSTSIVPFTDGYRTMNRHIGAAMNLAWGPLVIFTTCNYADHYSPLVVELFNTATRSVKATLPVGPENMACLSSVEPRMPTLKRMQKMCAASPRSAAKFWLLMEELFLCHLLGVSQAFLGKFRLQSGSSLTHLQEDDFASSGAPGLAMFCQGLLAPLEDQGRGFVHAHRKVYGVPSGFEDTVSELFRALADQLHNSAPRETSADAFAGARSRLLKAATQLQYDSAVEPGVQLGQAQPVSQKQLQQSRMDGGLEPDGSHRDQLVLSPAERLQHVVREEELAASENRPPRNARTEVPLTGCQLSVFPAYRLPSGFADLRSRFGSSATPWDFNERGELQRFVMPNSDSATLEDFERDSQAWSLQFSQDVRFLHVHCHDHCCTTTCVKYAKNDRTGEKGIIEKGSCSRVSIQFLFSVQFQRYGQWSLESSEACAQARQAFGARSLGAGFFHGFKSVWSSPSRAQASFQIMFQRRCAGSSPLQHRLPVHGPSSAC